MENARWVSYVGGWVNIPRPWIPLHAINVHRWKSQDRVSFDAGADTLVAAAAWREYPRIAVESEAKGGREGGGLRNGEYAVKRGVKRQGCPPSPTDRRKEE